MGRGLVSSFEYYFLQIPFLVMYSSRQAMALDIIHTETLDFAVKKQFDPAQLISSYRTVSWEKGPMPAAEVQ